MTWEGVPCVSERRTPWLCRWQGLGPEAAMCQAPGGLSAAQLRPTVPWRSLQPVDRTEAQRAKGLAQGRTGSHVRAPCPLPRSARPPATTQGTAGTHQVPGGSHQLVGGEREGLVAQVRIEHLLEDGPAASEAKSVGQSVGEPLTSTPGRVPRAGKTLGTRQ